MKPPVCVLLDGGLSELRANFSISLAIFFWEVLNPISLLKIQVLNATHIHLFF
jgi:hypothetical protein